MQNDRLTHDNRPLRDTESGMGMTAVYVIIALVVLAFLYFVASAYWSSPDTAPTTVIVPETSAPAPDAMAPAPDAVEPGTTLELAPPAAEPAPAPDVAPAPEPAPAPAPEPAPAPAP